MYSIQFWKSWTLANKRLLAVFAFLTSLSFCFFWISEFRSPSPVISPVVTREIIPTSFEGSTFRIGPFVRSVPADAYLVLERTEGGRLTPHFTANLLFLGFLMAGLTGLLAIITTLPRFWFFTGIGFFILILFGLRLDTVDFFGIDNIIPAVATAILILSPAFYFALVSSAVPFLVRWVTFLLVGGAVAAMIFYFGGTPNPILNVSANAIIPATAIMMVFIFMVAHEPLAALIGVISRGNRQTRSLTHFLVIGSIWLINLGILYANRKHIIQWNYLPMNIMIFISLSGILGLWGFRQRDTQFEEIIKGNPFGVLFYLCVALIGFGTLGFLFATANDPLIRLAEDSILYSSLGYGIIFMIYTINNFGSMLYQNRQVYRVLYQPENMPYFTFRLMGLICTIVFFAYSNWKVSLHQVYAGYYNLQGDRFTVSDTTGLAKENYKQAIFYAPRNYHGHYAMAQIFEDDGETQKEIKEYQALADYRPLDLAYLNLSHLTRGQNSLQASMDILRLGLHDFPKNGRLENELGLGFAAMNQKDSAFILIESAAKGGAAKSEASVNWMALQAQFRSAMRADSLLRATGRPNPGVTSNALALACVQGSSLDVNADPGTDTVLNVYQITTLHNSMINLRDHSDTALVSKTIALAHRNENPYIRDFLISGAAFAQYASGATGPGMKLLHEAAFAGQEEKYFNALGLWCLEQHAPSNSVGYFDLALKQDYKPATYNRAIGLTESHRFSEAIAAWQEIARSTDRQEQQQAEKMIAVLTFTGGADFPASWTDEEKYSYLRYKVELTDTENFEKTVNSMTTPGMKTRAIVDRSRQLDEAGESQLAYATLDALNEQNIGDPSVLAEFRHLRLLFLAQQGTWNEVEKAMQDKTLFTGVYRNVGLYLNASLAAAHNKKEIAGRDFKWLLDSDPFLEDGVVAAISWLGKDNPPSIQLYSALVSAMDLNPTSIKLLKIFAVMSLRLDYDEVGQTTLDQLKQRLSKQAFLDFLHEYPDLFEVKTN